MKRTKWFRAYLVDRDQPWWHNRLCIWWGRKPKVRMTEKGLDEGDHPHKLRFEWVFGLRNTFALGVQVGAEDGREVMLRVGIPWVLSVYVVHSVPAWFTRRILPWHQSNADLGWSLDRELSISTCGGSVYVYLWTHPMDSDYGDYGRTPMPGWRSFIVSINPLDLLGTQRCRRETLEGERAVLILMPEGEYCALLTVERMTWTRRLWPWWPLTFSRTHRDITCPDGIPFSGKGEDSWNCGEDGIYGMGFQVGNDAEACALFAAKALQVRKERGDPRVWPQLPRDRAARLANLRAQQCAEPAPREDQP